MSKRRSSPKPISLDSSLRRRALDALALTRREGLSLRAASDLARTDPRTVRRHAGHIITARWNGDPDARSKTEEWLASRGLALGTHYNRIDAVKEGEKFAVEAALDGFVDDNLVEVLRMAERRPDVGSLIVYDHPWKQTLDVARRLRRVRGWDELVPLLLTELEATARAGAAPSA